jgi:hypothetical protein
MSVLAQINNYLESLSTPKKSELTLLHEHIIHAHPKSQLWFLDGKDGSGKTVSNPNIGYGHCQLTYTNGTTKDWYKIGLTATTKGISVYVFGNDNKTYLKDSYGNRLGKANITGYCIQFKSLADIDLHVLKEVFATSLT